MADDREGKSDGVVHNRTSNVAALNTGIDPTWASGLNDSGNGNSAQGVIEFAEFPAVYFGQEVGGARFVFDGGRIVDAGARSGEDFLIQTLDTDEGARRLGELGIGCNPGIQRYMKNVGFDEKIDGTVHLAVGNSYTFTGGKNSSAIHWDIVKDLRTDGAIYVDGRLVQENGAWTI